jgi:peptidoglycan/xylan/chitin deacetylase (PgdA/CDA1 family)
VKLRTPTLHLLSPAGCRGRLLIFTYHRVLVESDPLIVDDPDASEFALQMDWIAEFCRVLPLPDAARALARGSLPERAACITFDDGYANNLDVAAPILSERELPATIFIAVDAVQTGAMWNDLVIEAIREARSEIDLRAVGGEHLILGDAASRSRAVPVALETLKYRPLVERWHVASELYQHTTGRPPPRIMLTEEGVRRIAAAGFDVGAHTVNHPILKTLPDEDADREIAGSRDWVSQVTGRRAVSFAYPNGRPGRDYDERHVAMVRKAGFEVAVSTHWGCSKRGDDVYQLARFAPWERTREGFWGRLVKTYVKSYM